MPFFLYRKNEKTIEIPLSVYENFLKQAEQIAELKQQIQWLMEQFHLFQNKQFGASGEQTDNEQLCLFNEAEQSWAIPDISEAKK